MRTPISTLRHTFRYLDDREQAQANLQAVSTARLCQLVVQVAHGFSGSKKAAPKVSARDFLPFPDWRPSPEDAPGPDQSTRNKLAELGKQRLLPIHVLAALMTPPEQPA